MSKWELFNWIYLHCACWRINQNGAISVEFSVVNVVVVTSSAP